MSEEVQERFEDSVEELNRFIEQLHSQKSARLPANLAPQQKPIYSMATLFHTASPHVADQHPSPEFSKQLYQRLRKEQIQAEEQLPGKGKETSGIGPRQGPDRGRTGAGQGPTLSASTARPQEQGQFRSIYKNNQRSQPTRIASTRPESTDVKKDKRRGLSRRTLFTGGTIAASLVAGAGIKYLIESHNQPSPPLVGQNVPATWHLVTTTDQLGTEAVPFTTNTITGYVVRQTQNGNPTDQIIAFSGACTHLGCMVQWQQDQHEFVCPCHGRLFDATGESITTNDRQTRYTSLPRLDTKIDDNGNIYVRVPLASV